MSHDLNEQQWPPRSPYEALMSSPSGRRKFRAQQEQDHTSPTASPSRRTLLSPSSLRSTQKQGVSLSSAINGENEDEEDEETLQLQLQAIEARLKLRRLRQAKIKAAQETNSEDAEEPTQTILTGSQEDRGGVTKRAPPSSRAGRTRGTDTQREVQIPLSPPPKRQKQEEAKSPRRVLLGIDKGLTGRDVSLRRAPSVRDGQASSESRTPRFLQPPSFSQEERPKSFSERIAQSRTAEKAQRERDERIRKARSKGFGLDEKEVESFKNNTQDFESLAGPAGETGHNSNQQEFSRDEVLRALRESTEGLSRRARPGSALQAGSRDVPKPKASQSATPSRAAPFSQTPSSSSALQPPVHRVDPNNPKEEETPSTSPADIPNFEPFSSLHLSKRILPHAFLARTLSGKKVLSIPDLLRTVKSPDYDLPDVDGDFVVVGVIASKSEPRSHKSGSNGSKPDGEQRSKYMVMTLTDLKWELEVFLFGSGFDRWWKLTPGTVLAILNPGIMPPPPNKRDTGKFSLTLNSSDDLILEIGSARDLGYCKSVKKDGKECGQWIDKRRTEFCEFHVNLQFQKTKASRMEVNTMSAPFAPGGRSGPSTGFFGGNGAGGRPRSSKGSGGNGGSGGSFKDDGLKKEGPVFDRETGSRVFIAPNMHPGAVNGGRSTACLLDDEDVDPDAFHRGMGKDERLRRRLAEHQRERDLAKKLGEAGDGMGGEYMRVRASSSSASSSARPNARIGDEGADNTGSDPFVDASALGLVKSSTRDIKLSPVKRKRADASSFSSGSQQPVGWGHAFKRGLPGQDSSISTPAQISSTSSSFSDGKRYKNEAVPKPALSFNSPRAPPTPSASAHKKLDERPSPRKRTRFVTEDGIKEAGADSVGVRNGNRLAVAAAEATRRGILRKTTTGNGNSMLAAGNAKGQTPRNNIDDDDDDDLLII
ncbi:hypothetical protein L228DRAFT_285690 [Xylona heveae TC161]|uniref:Uncharacterized protein n=1 Tax=Xylona heveae (strain CBS 132557 / TC161) TaxID=1328760 RepID=A0A164ZZW1_XYLHT|nr:hypothetical protein L228DRAFT_285690 [Xylona heveae TC161]KZF19753.1 hypothetical protein L228DRAFT_285690 [Xylona heveae TC161]